MIAMYSCWSWCWSRQLAASTLIGRTFGVVYTQLCWQTYAWLVLESLFSEVLTRDEWLCLMDNVFSNHPSFLLVCVVAYCVVGRTALLRCTERDDFEVSLHDCPWTFGCCVEIISRFTYLLLWNDLTVYVCVCVCLSVFLFFVSYAQPQLCADRHEMWHMAS